MQKKDYSSEHQSSSWQDNIKKQERTDMFKKIAMWAGIIAVSIAGLAGLVVLADRSSGSSQQAPVESANFPKINENDIVLGDPSAKVTFTEYADFQCPACASYNPVTNRLLEEYKGKAKLVYRFFPLKSIHKNALISAQAAYAAWKLGKFSEMKDMLYDNQKDWEALSDPREIFEGYASTIGLDVEKFRGVMNSDEAKKAVEAGEKEAIGLGLNSTPSFFIENKKIQPSGYDDFKKLIDEELNKN